MRIFLVLALLVNYMLRAPQLIDQFHASRFAFMSIVLLLGVVMILPKLKKVDFHLLDAAIFSFFGVNMMSLFWASDFSEAIFTTQKTFVLAVAYYLFRHILAAKDEGMSLFISRLFQVLTLFATVVISYRVMEVGLSEGLGGKAVYKIVTHAGHKNLVASFLFLLLGLNFFFAHPRQNKLIFYTMIGWQLLLILLLRSRAVYMSCAVFGFVMGIHHLLNGAASQRALLKKVLPMFAGLAVIGSVIITQTKAGEDYAKYLNPLHYFDNASSKERLFVWYKTSELVKDQPALGVGAGNWKIFFPSKSIGGGYRLEEQDLVFTRTHNDFLEVLAELGLIGLLSYLLVFGLGIWVAYKAIQLAKPQMRQKRAILLGMLLGYCVIAFFDFPKERIEHQVMLGLILAAIAWKGQSWLKKQAFYIELNTQQLKILTAALSLVLLLHLPTGYFRVKGDYYCMKMFSAKNAKNYPAMQAFAKQAHSDWNVLDPLVIPYRWYEGLGLYMAGKFSEALPHFEKAYDQNPYNFNVINNYAGSLVQVGNYEAAIPLFHDALRINPKFEDAMFNLSFSYFQVNQFESAKEWAEKTKKNPNKKAEFLQTINQAIEASRQQ